MLNGENFTGCRIFKFILNHKRETNMRAFEICVEKESYTPTDQVRTTHRTIEEMELNGMIFRGSRLVWNPPSSFDFEPAFSTVEPTYFATE